MALGSAERRGELNQGLSNKETLDLLSSSDTIAAPATPRGKSAIGIVRLSGSQSPVIADRIFRPSQGTLKPSERQERKLIHGSIVDPQTGEFVDEALLVLMKAPHSYTGEDMCEIQAHGS
ncbi:MAG TPA: hypothetical protein PKH07_20040, partial [bacterium]|nr:hypothetical protein [bacterium]